MDVTKYKKFNKLKKVVLLLLLLIILCLPLCFYTVVIEEKVTIDIEYCFEFDINNLYMSDHVMVKNELWVFGASSDDHSKYSEIQRYKIDFDLKTVNQVDSLKHNLGHVNTIDYCSETDTLICGNGSSDITLAGEIYILNDISLREVFNYEDCIVIKTPEEWGFKVNALWGEESDIIIVISNNNNSIRKIRLTRFNGEFTGEYTLINEYCQDKNTNLDVNQGSAFYNGYLYIAMGHNGVWFEKIKLNEYGFVYDEYYETIDDLFTEGIEVYDDYLLIGVSNYKILVYCIN